jgi:hypothetical protein
MAWNLGQDGIMLIYRLGHASKSGGFWQHSSNTKPTANVKPQPLGVDLHAKPVNIGRMAAMTKPAKKKPNPTVSLSKPWAAFSHKLATVLAKLKEGDCTHPAGHDAIFTAILLVWHIPAVILSYSLASVGHSTRERPFPRQYRRP